MSVFTAANVIVSNPGCTRTPASGISVQPWDSNASYSDGQTVVFNGSLYVAIGSPPAGLIPPLEVATPKQSGSPKWALATRGRTPAVPWDESTRYYQDQVVRYLGGTFVLDQPTVPVGTRPNAHPAWTPLSEVLTVAESQRVSTRNLGNIGPDITAHIFEQADETARVRNHRVRVASIGTTPPGPLYELTFPVPIDGHAPPELAVTPEDQGAWGLGLALQPVYSLSQCVGYRCLAAQGFQRPGTYEFSVTIKQPIA